jgi:hypothetical protein
LTSTMMMLNGAWLIVRCTAGCITQHLPPSCSSSCCCCFPGRPGGPCHETFMEGGVGVQNCQ